MRGFRCVPVSLKYSTVMAVLSSFERDVVYSALVAQDDRHCLPYDAAPLRSEIFPTRPFVELKVIAKARDRLVALGVFARRSTARKVWLEIAPDFRHTEGRIETSFGDTDPPPEQAELSLGPVLLPSRAAPGERKPPRARAINGSRAEVEEKRKDHESAPRAAGEGALGAQRKDSRDSGAVRGEDSGLIDAARRKREDGAFAAGEKDAADAAWGDFVRWMNDGQMMSEEMWQNGKAHLARLSENRIAFVEATMAGILREKEGGRLANRGAYFVERFEAVRGERRVA